MAIGPLRDHKTGLVGQRSTPLLRRRYLLHHNVKMSFPRLPFLYPHLFKQALLHETSHAPVRVRHVQLQRAGISTCKPLKQETYAQRYGTAAEPEPPPSGSSMPSKPQDEASLAGAIEKEVKGPPKPEEQKKISVPPSASKEPAKASPSKEKDKPDSDRDDAISTTLRDPSARATELNTSESHLAESADAATAAKNSENARKPKPLETIMQMHTPTVEKPEEHEAPHLQARPYVHHFDTYTLVKDLQGGGFTEDQSVTIMKAVRGLLAINLDVAKEELESKSDVENVLPPPNHPEIHNYIHLIKHRKHTSSAPPAPNSAPKSSTPANPPAQKRAPNSPTSNTPTTSSPNAPLKKPSPSKTSYAACSTTAAWPPACRPSLETARSAN